MATNRWVYAATPTGMLHSGYSDSGYCWSTIRFKYEPVRKVYKCQCGGCYLTTEEHNTLEEAVIEMLDILETRK